MERLQKRIDNAEELQAKAFALCGEKKFTEAFQLIEDELKFMDSILEEEKCNMSPGEYGLIKIIVEMMVSRIREEIKIPPKL